MPRSIRTRVIYTVLLVLLITGIGFVALINGIVRNSFIKMENESMRRDSLRVQAAIDSNTSRLKSVAGDWGRWTDTYDFIAGTNPTYVQDNLSLESMEVLSADFMAYLDVNGKTIHVSAIDRTGGKLLTPSTAFSSAIERLHTNVYAQRDGSEPEGGPVLLPGGPALVVFQGVTTSNGKKPVNGTLAVGAYLDAAHVEEVKSLSQLDVVIASPSGREKALPAEIDGTDERLGEVYVAPQGKSRILSWATIRGIDGKPAFFYAVSEPRAAMQRATDTLNYVGLGLLGIVTLAGIAIAITLDRAVMGRLTRLHNQVADISSLETTDRRVTVEGDDEITDIAVALNTNFENLAMAEDALKHAADHDYLTGLVNRRRFETDVEKALAESERTGASLAWVLIDLDDFKDVNDRFGHHCGDSVLVWFAELMRTTIRRYSTIARLGGDEFAILLPHSDEYDAAVVADRLLTALSDAVCEVCDGHAFHIDASVGMAVAPRDGTTVSDLSRAADDAMYHAKISRMADRESA